MLRFPYNKNSGLQLGRYSEQEDTLVEARINGGMVTSIDSADIQNNQFVDLKNVHVRYDKTSRRHGLIKFTPLKPNNNRVLLFTAYERFDKSVTLMRFTSSTIHSGSLSAWTPVVGVLNGSNEDRFTTSIANDRMFFANNGADPIQEINGLVFAQAGNAPNYRYLTSFNNRLVAANLAGAPNNPIKIGWSGNLNFTEWDTGVDPSAGFQILIDSPTDYADDITGIFGFTDEALILRERSLWRMTKQPAASSPFAFSIVAPGIGCDSPYSAISIRNGIAWFDFRTGTVYAYTANMAEPEPIGRPIENTLIEQVVDVSKIFAGYNTVTDEYSLAIPNAASESVRIWTYNFRTRAWWCDEYDNISSVNNIDYSSATLVIDDLVGTIDSLVGTIDSLVNNAAIASRFFGRPTGEIMIQSKNADTDDGVAYNTQIISKTFSIPRRATYISKLRIEFQPLKAGSFSVYYSKDGGLTWVLYKVVSWSDLSKRKLATFTKNLRCDLFTWKLVSTSGLWDLLEYEASIVQSKSETRER